MSFLLGAMQRIIFPVALLLLLLVAGCDTDTGPKVQRAGHIKQIAATPDQLQRRARSEGYCTEHNIPVYPNKADFYVTAEQATTIRTPDEITNRLLALCMAELKSEKTEQEWLDSFDRKYNVMPKLSPKERVFIQSTQPSEQEMIDASWKVECMHVLLWALGYTDSLGYPSQASDVDAIMQQVFSRTETQLRTGAKPRTKAEILDAADLLLRMHWACVEAELNKTTIPAKLEHEVVLEWHYALNWLIGYMNQSWDDVATDT
jgi:hypothetical protein